jgi:hypothetical protein
MKIMTRTDNFPAAFLAGYGTEVVITTRRLTAFCLRFDIFGVFNVDICTCHFSLLLFLRQVYFETDSF